MKKYLFILLAFVIIFSCKTKTKETEESIEKEEVKKEEPKEEQTNMATLTAEQLRTIDVQYGSIEKKQLTAILKANGVLNVPNNNKANATSLYGGVIKTLNIQVGSNVRKGQVIATIANPQFIQLQEEYLSIAGDIIFAEQEQQRQKELNMGNAGALKNLQQAEAKLQSLRTRKASIQQQLQLMGINPGSINNTNLRSLLPVTSPISGTVSNVFAKIGTYVDVTSPVAEIVDNSQLHVDLNVFEKDLPLLKNGQIIHFKITNNPDNEYDAQIFSIGSAFEPNSKTIPIHATVKGNKTGLIDGMNITALVSLNNVTSAAVPNEAIVNHQGQDYIFIVSDKSENDSTANKATSFVMTPVIKGTTELGYTAITPVNDIPTNAKVVVKGAFFILAKMTNTEEEE
jgi:RND family efflux transporter MFP subunit